MKRIYLLFSAVLGLVLALTACGSSGSSGGTTTASAGGSSGGSSCAGSSSSAGAGGASAGAASGASASASYPAGTGSTRSWSAAFQENVVLADIYAEALKAKGVKVADKLNIGSPGATSRR